MPSPSKTTCSTKAAVSARRRGERGGLVGGLAVTVEAVEAEQLRSSPGPAARARGVGEHAVDLGGDWAGSASMPLSAASRSSSLGMLCHSK